MHSHKDPWTHIPEDRKWKYAHCERERRYQLTAHPSLPELKPALKILDKYVHGTNFRLRKADNGTRCEYKLQKKLRLEPDRTDQLWNSTTYISEAEYALFWPLPGKVLEKLRRFVSGPEGETVSVDEIETGEGKVWIAEVEFDELVEMEAYVFGLAHLRELTHVPGWSGYELTERWGK